MSVLVFIETNEGQLKPSSFESLTYGAEVANKMGTDVTAVAIGDVEHSELEKAGNYGAKKVIHLNDERLHEINIQPYATAIAKVAESEGSEIIILPKSSLSDSISARIAAKLSAGVVSNVVDLPDTSNGFVVKRSIYTGKAFANVEIETQKKVIALRKGAIEVKETGGSASVEDMKPEIPDSDFAVKVTNVDKATGDILLPEADLVVSAGRGLKGPENWGMIEDLAKTLGAATACSKPVSDMDWRPHHEHVGQTGIKVSPSLYIAVGISGAIQHLAGVNSSKVIVVINKDAEAPFFKAADYGVVGDAFDVVPKLNEALKKAL